MIKSKVSNSFIFLVVTILFMRSYAPFIASIIPLSLSLVLYLSIYALILPKLKLWQIRWCIAIFIMLFWEVLMSLLGVNQASLLNTSYTLVQAFAWGIVGEYVLTCCSSRYARNLLFVFLLVLMFTSITTYLGCVAYPGASRNLATGMTDDNYMRSLYARMNIGGFDFIYQLVLLLPFLCYSVRHLVKRNITKIMLVIVIFYMYLAVIESEYTMALLLSSSALMFVVFPKDIRGKHVILVIISILFIYLFLAPWLSSIFANLAESTESYDYSIRFKEISDVLVGKQTDGDFNERRKLWMRSWNMFAEHPILGTGTRGGGHSFVLDNLVMYGIFSVILLSFQLYSMYKRTVLRYKYSSYYWMLVIVFSLNVILCVLNTINFYNIFVLFIPLFYKALDRT